MSVNIGQAIVTATVSVRQTRVVDPHQVQDRRVKVVDVNGLVHSTDAMFIGRSVDVASFHAGTSEP